MNAGEFINQVSILTGLNKNEAAISTEIVLGFISHRIQSEEARDVESQLPAGIKELWNSDRSLRFTEKLFKQRLDYKNIEEFYSRIQEELESEKVPQTAGIVVDSVFRTLKDQISEGQAKHIWANLPEEIQEVWEKS